MKSDRIREAEAEVARLLRREKQKTVLCGAACLLFLGLWLAFCQWLVWRFGR